MHEFHKPTKLSPKFKKKKKKVVTHDDLWQLLQTDYLKRILRIGGSLHV